MNTIFFVELIGFDGEYSVHKRIAIQRREVKPINALILGSSL